MKKMEKRMISDDQLKKIVIAILKLLLEEAQSVPEEEGVKKMEKKIVKIKSDDRLKETVIAILKLLLKKAQSVPENKKVKNIEKMTSDDQIKEICVTIDEAYLSSLLKELQSIPRETERQLEAVPEDGVEFTLKVNNNIDPMEVVTSAGYRSDDLEYLGPKLEGEQTYQAELVHLGYVRNLDEAREKAEKMGYRLVEGQAREPFKAKFPKPDGGGPVVFGGSEWRDPGRCPSVAYLCDLEGEWHSGFTWSNICFPFDWRWLVVDK